jgi:hypothetical protein
MKRLFSWIGAEKPIPHVFIKSHLLKTIQSVDKMFSWMTSLSKTSLLSFIQSVISRTGNIAMALRQPMNYLQIIGNYPSVQSLVEHKSTALSPPVNFMRDDSKHLNFWMPANERYMKAIGSIASDSITVPRRTVFNDYNEDFYFHKRQNIEREVEEIKKIMVETKEAVAEKSRSVNFPDEIDIKRHLDINRISDQVYQNMERRIRMERERRGL